MDPSQGYCDPGLTLIWPTGTGVPTSNTTRSSFLGVSFAQTFHLALALSKLHKLSIRVKSLQRFCGCISCQSELNLCSASRNVKLERFRPMVELKPLELKPLGLESISIRPRLATTKRPSVLVAGPRTQELLAERKLLAGNKLLAGRSTKGVRRDRQPLPDYVLSSRSFSRWNSGQFLEGMHLRRR